MKKNSVYQFFSTNVLLSIILLAFVIRMVFFVSLQPWNNEVVDKAIIVKDAIGYHQLALSVLSKKSFEYFDAFRTPGYPVFVALIYGISSGSVWFVLLIQILLNLISVLLVYKIASIFFSRKIALLSAFLFAIDACQALLTVALLTETLFVFLFLASVYYLCKSIKENKFYSIFLSAIFLGIATLVRPISFLFPFVAIIFILMFFNLKLKMKVFYSVLFSIVFIATISPWLIHNYSKYGEAKISSISGYNLFFYNAAYTELYKTGKTIKQVNKNFDDLAIKQGIDSTDKNSFKNSQIYYNIAQQYIKDNLILYCKVHFMGIVNMYAGIGAEAITKLFHLNIYAKNQSVDTYPDIFTRFIDFFQSKTIAEIFIFSGLGFYLLINYLFSLYGIFIFSRERANFVFLCILIVLYFSVLTGVVGESRYRLPVMPFINILCAVGLFHFYFKVTDKLARRSGLGVSINAIDAPRRVGDLKFLVADATKAKRVLNWQPQYQNITEILSTAIVWHSVNGGSQYQGLFKSHGIEFLKYLLASVISLFIDYSFYWILVEYHFLSQPNAAVIGYLIGLVVAYFLLVAHVFQDGWLRKKKHYESMLFLFSGLVGAASTYMTVSLYLNLTGKQSHLAKLIAIGVSFFIVYLLRKFIVFKKNPRFNS